MSMEFQFNRPVEVALKFETGYAFQTKGGRDRVMFTLMNEEKMFVDPLVATRIEQMGFKRGEPFLICKRRQGRSVEWNLTRAGESVASSAELDPDHVGMDDLPPFADEPGGAVVVQGVSRELLIQALEAAVRILKAGGK